MKLPVPKRPSCRGYTLVEVIVAMGVFGLLGGVFFSVLNSGIVLFAKNTAVNAAHEEARQGISRLTRDIHAAVSVPQLRDVNFGVVSPKPVNGIPPVAAGVSFQNIASGPNYIWKDPNNATLIMIKDRGNKPVPGQHLLIPFWGSFYEADIVKVSASSAAANHSNVFLSNGSDTKINPRLSASADPAYAITYYTDRVAYVVRNGVYTKDTRMKDAPVAYTTNDNTNFFVAPAGTPPGKLYRYGRGELHLFKQRYNGGSFYWEDVAVVARNLTTPTPFSVPLNAGGSPDTKYVAVKLSASDPKSSNREFKATHALLDTQIDYRAAITVSY